MVNEVFVSVLPFVIIGTTIWFLVAWMIHNYLIALLLRFGISGSREYMADAGTAEMTHKPYALANALRKIDQDPLIEAVQNRDIAQLFIENPQPEEKKFPFSNLFSTHPPIGKRIELLDQFA